MDAHPPIFPSPNADLGHLAHPEIEQRLQLQLDQSALNPDQLAKKIERGYGFDTDQLKFIRMRAKVSHGVKNVLSKFYPGWDKAKN